MKLVQKGNCTIACYAMLMDYTYEQAIATLPHDGSEIWWPEERGQLATRGITIDEINDVLLPKGFVLAQYISFPMAYSRDREKARPVYPDKETLVERMTTIVSHGKGIITGIAYSGSLMQCGHALAFEDGVIFDPRGSTSHHTPDDFGTQFAYRLAALV